MRLRITVEGRTYDVDVEVVPEPEAAEPEAIELPASFLKARPPSDVMPEDRICRSPIAGIIVSLAVKPGDVVRKEDPLITIEAMKMQTTIGSPSAGTVEAIRVGPGDLVKTGQVLVELV